MRFFPVTADCVNIIARLSLPNVEVGSLEPKREIKRVVEEIGEKAC